MRQLLILGFHCDIYRRPPVIRVFIDNLFQDEFEVSQTNYDEKWHNREWLKIIRDRKRQYEEMIVKLSAQSTDTDTIIKIKEEIKVQNKALANKYYEKNALFLKFLEFDDDNKKDLTIKIEIKSSDSNYSNGFLSKSTLVMLNQLWIISENLLERLKTIDNDYRYRYISTLSIKRLMFGSRLITDSYSRNVLSTNISVTSGGKKINTQMPINLTWFGNNTLINIKLIKKHNTWVEANNSTKGVWRLGNIENVRYLYDKYKQYEDTRSTDT